MVSWEEEESWELRGWRMIGWLGTEWWENGVDRCCWWKLLDSSDLGLYPLSL